MLLNRKATGLACGIIWAVIIFFIGLAGAFGLARDTVNFIAEFYVGFGPTLEGSLIGMIWAFLEGFVIGYLYAWIYNFFARKEEEL